MTAEGIIADLRALRGDPEVTSVDIDVALALADEVERLRAIDKGRWEHPTEAELRAHRGAGGAWLVTRPAGRRGERYETSYISDLRTLLSIVRRASKFWLLWVPTLGGRACAWPDVAAPERGEPGGSARCLLDGKKPSMDHYRLGECRCFSCIDAVRDELLRAEIHPPTEAEIRAHATASGGMWRAGGELWQLVFDDVGRLVLRRPQRAESVGDAAWRLVASRDGMLWFALRDGTIVNWPKGA